MYRMCIHPPEGGGEGVLHHMAYTGKFAGQGMVFGHPSLNRVYNYFYVLNRK